MPRRRIVSRSHNRRSLNKIRRSARSRNQRRSPPNSGLLPTLLAPAYECPAGTVSGPVETKVLRVAEARVWPGHAVTVSVRIRGIDAPEIRSRCAAERAAAKKARAMLGRLLGDGPVTVSNIGGDKYYGRVLADVTTAGGTAIGPAMRRLGAVRAYGGKTRQTMCRP